MTSVPCTYDTDEKDINQALICERKKEIEKEFVGWALKNTSPKRIFQNISLCGKHD